VDYRDGQVVFTLSIWDEFPDRSLVGLRFAFPFHVLSYLKIAKEIAVSSLLGGDDEMKKFSSLMRSSKDTSWIRCLCVALPNSLVMAASACTFLYILAPHFG
jgi:hypothetical protein